ncbi:MAG: hypothetical protein QNJ89_08595 [Acidimicrobiia bacterium]|nr:hypothetical protein [Acidimicrobiia bacterium]
MAGEASRFALAADAMTGLRAGIAAPLFWFAATERFDVAAALLAIAWWSDLLDGRLARRSGIATRLGPWDFVVDTLVGAALLAGLTASGLVALLPWGLAGIALLLGFFVWRNLALGMLVQAIAYGFLLAELWAREPVWMLALTASIGGILIADYRRFTTFVLPTFFAGLTGKHERGRTAAAD